MSLGIFFTYTLPPSAHPCENVKRVVMIEKENPILRSPLLHLSHIRTRTTVKLLISKSAKLFCNSLHTLIA